MQTVATEGFAGDVLGYVILTAAVTPDPRFGSVLSDPKVRLGQYHNALAYWSKVAEKRDWKVLVVETTGFAAHDLVTPAEQRVQALNFHPDDALVRRGKGAIEAAAIDFLLREADVPSSATFYKVTGRLTLANSSQLLTEVADGAALARRTIDGKYCDTRLFATQAAFWREHLGAMAEEVDETCGRYLEHVLAFRLVRAEYLHDVSVERFKRRPILVGISGTTGAHYGKLSGTLKNKLLSPVENAIVERFMKKQI